MDVQPVAIISPQAATKNYPPKLNEWDYTASLILKYGLNIDCGLLLTINLWTWPFGAYELLKTILPTFGVTKSITKRSKNEQKKSLKEQICFDSTTFEKNSNYVEHVEKYSSQ